MAGRGRPLCSGRKSTLGEELRKRKAGEITDEQADSLKGLAHNARTEATDRAYEEARKSREADRDAALRDLAKDSPELAAHIIDIRQKLIIPLQKKLVDSGLDKNIGAKISKTGGIYITRSYRMFTDSSYLQKVREDPDYQDVRDAAMEFFEDQYKKTKVKELVDGGMDESRAKVEARIQFESDPESLLSTDSLALPTVEHTASQNRYDEVGIELPLDSFPSSKEWRQLGDLERKSIVLQLGLERLERGIVPAGSSLLRGYALSRAYVSQPLAG